MDSLVERLSKPDENHVEVVLRPEKTAVALKRRIDEYSLVHIRFTNTQGGTELGVTLDRTECELENGQFESGTGKIKLVGDLVLNYVPVKCIAHIDLASLTGTGYLVPRASD